MKPRSRLKAKGNCAPVSAPGVELPEANSDQTGDGFIKGLIADLDADEQLELARELERRANLILAHLGKKPNPTRPAVEASAGGWVARDVWIKVGLSPNQARQLKALGRQILAAEARTSAEAARWIITQGLANIELLEAAVGGFKVQSKLALAAQESPQDQRARGRLMGLN